MTLPHGAPPLRHWLVGLTLSLAVAWAAGAVFLDTVQPVAFDPQVGRYVAMPGTTSRTRGEGWANSNVGEHGIRGLPGGRLPAGPKVVFWGDSFVEGMQVDDADRMAQVFTSLSRAVGFHLTGVGIGHGGDTLIDSIFKASDYASALGPVALNVYFLGRISDVLPDAPRPCRAAFYSTPEPHLQRNDCPPSELAVRFAPALRRLEASGAYSAYLKLRNLQLRLAPGPATPTAAPAAQASASVQADTQNLAPLWDYLIGQVRQASPGPVLFLYAPDVPTLTTGRVEAAYPDAATAAAFAAACLRNGVGFINLGPELAAHFQATGRFPRGFFNSPPGTGHLNEDGHLLVAETVAKYVKEHRDALLAP